MNKKQRTRCASVRLLAGSMLAASVWIPAAAVACDVYEMDVQTDARWVTQADGVIRGEVVMPGEWRHAWFGARPVQDSHVVRQSQDVSITIKDGDISVRVNGEKIPSDRLRRENGRIIIVDKDGKEVDAFRSFFGPGMMESHDMDWERMDFPFGRTDRESSRRGGAVAPTVMLGVYMDEPSPALVKHLGLAPGTTTLITALYEGLPAHEAGLEEFDIITKIEGKAPADPGSLQSALAEKQPGDALRLTVIQGGHPRMLELKLDAYDEQALAEATVIGEPHDRSVGGQFFFGPGADLPEELRGFYRSVFPRRSNVLVDPRHRVFTVPLTPDIPAQPKRNGARAEDGGQLDGRLNRLDDRLADLESMLNALLERAAREQED